MMVRLKKLDMMYGRIVFMKKDRNGNETYRQYNACGQLLKEILPSGQSWECIYDDNGNLLKKFANTGQEVRYTYDSFGF